jgi:hypothetical protein
MRRSEGDCRLVRRASIERRVLIEVFEGMVRGIAVRRHCQFFVLTLFGYGYGCMCCSEALGTTGRLGLTVCAGDGLDEDLHRVFGVGAGGADAADAGGAGHGCSWAESGLWRARRRGAMERQRRRAGDVMYW